MCVSSVIISLVNLEAYSMAFLRILFCLIMSLVDIISIVVLDFGVPTKSILFLGLVMYTPNSTIFV